MCPRSESKPSEMSMALCAMPRNANPSITRGVGRSSRRDAAASCSGVRRSFLPRAATASAASPNVPETHTSSPARAPSRCNALCAGTSPMICTHRLSGPRVVSPPIRSTPCVRASRTKPREKAASQRASAFGSASASVAQRGVAPIAARSDKLTASVLCPSASGSAPAKKCVPSTSISAEIAST